MKTLTTSIGVLCIVTLLTSSANAEQYPCGPDGVPRFLRPLIPQGAFGADFRPACRNHDRAYESRGLSRKQIDQDFRREMHCACESSKHPVLCKMAANHRYRMVRLFGGAAFRKSR